MRIEICHQGIRWKREAKREVAKEEEEKEEEEEEEVVRAKGLSLCELHLG